jgi:hypothetical protein
MSSHDQEESNEKGGGGGKRPRIEEPAALYERQHQFQQAQLAALANNGYVFPFPMMFPSPASQVISSQIAVQTMQQNLCTSMEMVRNLQAMLGDAQRTIAHLQQQQQQVQAQNNSTTPEHKETKNAQSNTKKSSRTTTQKRISDEDDRDATIAELRNQVQNYETQLMEYALKVETKSKPIEYKFDAQMPLGAIRSILDFVPHRPTWNTVATSLSRDVRDANANAIAPRWPSTCIRKRSEAAKFGGFNVVFSNDSQWLLEFYRLEGSHEYSFRRWHIRNGPTDTVTIPGKWLRISDDRSHLIVFGFKDNENCARLYTLSPENCMVDFENAIDLKRPSGASSEHVCLANISSSGRHLATLHQRDDVETLVIWDVKERRILKSRSTIDTMDVQEIYCTDKYVFWISFVKPPDVAADHPDFDGREGLRAYMWDLNGNNLSGIDLWRNDLYLDYLHGHCITEFDASYMASHPENPQIVALIASSRYAYDPEYDDDDDCPVLEYCHDDPVIKLLRLNSSGPGKVIGTICARSMPFASHEAHMKSEYCGREFYTHDPTLRWFPDGVHLAFNQRWYIQVYQVDIASGTFKKVKELGNRAARLQSKVNAFLGCLGLGVVVQGFDISSDGKSMCLEMWHDEEDGSHYRIISIDT